MTSRFDRPIIRIALIPLVAAWTTSLAAGARASAEVPPAAVDEYRPAPPPNPDFDPGRGGDRGPDGGDAGVPSPDSTGSEPGPGVPSGPGSPPAGIGAGGPDAGREGPGPAGGSGGGAGESFASRGERSGGAPGAAGTAVAGYPLTTTLAIAVAAIAAGLCAGLGLALRRRYRAGPPLADSR
jgi:hypothetical protein